jgi:hypothetical protein
LGYFHSHEGATALLPYFIQWYKTGVQPTISNDSIFWAYRTQSVNDQAASNVPAVNSGTNYGPIADEIYVTANLAQPGILTVTSGSKVTSFTLTPGGTDVQAPFVDGNTPSFTFTPTGSSAPELSGSGTDPIGIYTYLPAGGTAIQYNDEYYSTGDLIGAPLKTAPQAPTLSPAIAGNASVALNWTASFGSTPITYNVYRGTSSGGESSTPIATGLSVLTYTDSTALNGTTYYYVVKGINSFGTSPNSNEVNATPSAPTLPSVPAVQTPTSGEGTISLTWSASTGTAPITYTVYRGTTSGGEVQLAAGLVTTTYTDTGLANNTTYYYVVSATNAAGTSKKSNEVSSTTLNVLLQIDSGGPGASPFVADEDFSAGGNEFSAGSTVSLTGVVSPAPEAVYQTVRWASSFTYTIPNLTAGNSYLVRLHFAELTWTAAGQRVFNVAINGTPVLTNFDIFATAGGLQALVEQFNAIANSSGQVVVSFTQGTADNPEVAGIEILGSTTSTPTAATPAFNPAAGTYTSAQSVTLSDSTSGAAIYYTTNGTTPTVSSTKYTGAIGVSATETIEAIAIANGYNNSAVASATYTISTPTAATPAFSPGAGTYTSAQSVTLSDATSGAKIYYTTNGTAPTTSSTLYSGAIAVSATETIEAIAVASGYNNSAVATAAYTISTMSPATITASVTSLAFGTVSVGSSSVPQTVALKNTGSSTATISSITAGTGFTETNTCGSSLAVGASCTASVVFTPTSATSFSANLTVSSNATDGTLTVALTGTGGSSTTNLALSATATAGSSASGYPASNVNDGNTSTYWESLDGAAYPQTLTLNFGKVESLGSVTLTLPPSTAWTTRTETLSVLGSNNGTSWTTIVASAGYTFNPSTTPSNTVSFNLPAGTSYQYLQLSFTANTGWTAAQISEFEVYSGTTGSGEGPFGGTPAAIPGTVLAENYDTGGQGIAYNVTSVNGTDNSYRSDGVDLETATSPATGNDLGWTASGQWFKYTVNVATAGTYTVSFLVAAPSAVTDGFHLSNSSGTNLSGAVNVTATGGWQDWATVTATVTLPAGLQVLTLNEDNAGWNIDTATFAVQ